MTYTWGCALCRKYGTVEIPEGAGGMSSVYLVGGAHKDKSPHCDQHTAHIRVSENSEFAQELEYKCAD